MRDETPPIPFRERWPINKAQNTNKKVNKNGLKDLKQVIHKH